MMGRYPLLGPWRRPGRDDAVATERALERMGMADLRDRQIGALSGGQRRRVFLARAMAADAQLFLLDEPVTAIDPVTQDDIMDVLGEEAAAGRTVDREHPRPGLRRRVLPAGGGRESDHRRRRPVVDCPRRGGPGPRLRRPPAPPGWRSRARRRRPPSRRAAGPRAPLPRRRARVVIDLILDPARLRHLPALAVGRGDGRHRLRGRGHVRRAQGPGVHRRRDQPRRLPGRGGRLHPGWVVLRRRGHRRGVHGARHSVHHPARRPPLGHRRSASCSPACSRSGSSCSARSTATSATCSLPVRQRPGHQPHRPGRPRRPRPPRRWSSWRILWKELLYATFDPLGAAASGLKVEAPRVPVPGAWSP